MGTHSAPAPEQSPNDMLTVVLSQDYYSPWYDFAIHGSLGASNYPDAIVEVPRCIYDTWVAALSLYASVQGQIETIVEEMRMPDAKTTADQGTDKAIPDGPEPTVDHPAEHMFTVIHTVSAQGSDVPWQIHQSDPGTPDGAIAFIRERLLNS